MSMPGETINREFHQQILEAAPPPGGSVDRFSDPVPYDMPTFMSLIHELPLIPDDVGEVVRLTAAIIHDSDVSSLVVANPDSDVENLLSMFPHGNIAHNRGLDTEAHWLSAYIAETAAGQNVLFVDPGSIGILNEGKLADALANHNISSVRSDGGYELDDGSYVGLVGTILNASLLLYSAGFHNLGYEQAKRAHAIIADGFRSGHMIHGFTALEQAASA